MDKLYRLTDLFGMKVRYSKNLIRLYIIYPVLLSVGSLFLLYSSGPAFSNPTQYDIEFSAFVSLFITFAGVFCIIPASIVIMFTLPRYLFIRNNETLRQSGVLLKTSFIFEIISGIAICTSFLI